MKKPRASETMTAVFEFNRYGDFTGNVYFNVKNEEDGIILHTGVSRLLRRWNLTLKKGTYKRSAK